MAFTALCRASGYFRTHNIIHDMRWDRGLSTFELNLALVVAIRPCFTPGINNKRCRKPFDADLIGVAVPMDEADSIIAYTHGWHLNNQAHQPMLNGGGLNPTTVVDTTWGLHRANSQIFLPRPAQDGLFVLVHMAPDAVNGNGLNHSVRLYFTVIDK
ncbi:MAG: hypothetical protein R2818_12510 [Flavobacteriales bacterium]